jgi:hypothetical protein
MRCQMSFFTSVDTGVILNRFSQDMTLVDAVLPSEAFGTLKGEILGIFGGKIELMLNRSNAMPGLRRFDISGLELYGSLNAP